MGIYYPPGTNQAAVVAALQLLSIGGGSSVSDKLDKVTLSSQTIAGNVTMIGTGAFGVAAGTTAQRPNSGDIGQVRWNSTTGAFEFGHGAVWDNFGRLGAANTFAEIQTLNKGFIFNGSAGFVAGSLSVNSDWGGYIRGRSGAIADVALAASDSTLALSIIHNNGTTVPRSGLINIPKGLLVANGTSVTWDGGTSDTLIGNTQILASPQFSGTIPSGTGSVGGGIPLGLGIGMTDDLEFEGGSDAGAMTIVGLEDTVSATAKGTRCALLTILRTPTGGTTTIKDLLGGGFKTYLRANMGGTAQNVTDASGGTWAAGLAVLADENASYLNQVSGLEVDIYCTSNPGEEPLRRHGIFIAGTSYDFISTKDASQGYVTDVGYQLMSTMPVPATGVNPGWRHGFAVGDGTSGRPIDLGTGNPYYGFAFGAVMSGAAQWDFTNQNTMGSLLNGIVSHYTHGSILVPGFRVGPTGQIWQGVGSLVTSSATTTLDTTRFSGPAVAATISGGNITNGGSNVQVGMPYYDAYGGVYYVDTVNGSEEATSVTVWTQPTDSTNRTGSITLTPDRAATAIWGATNITTTQTWTAGTTVNIGTGSATLVQIGRSAGSVSFPTQAVTIGGNAFSGVATAINAAAGSVRALDFKTAGSLRFRIDINSVAEGGSNAGSNVEFNVYNDSQTLIGTALTFIRSTMDATFGSLVAATHFRQGASGPTWRSGTGSPESAVTAPVGSIFSRTDGGASTSFYVKESGSGNTGWVAK